MDGGCGAGAGRGGGARSAKGTLARNKLTHLEAFRGSFFVNLLFFRRKMVSGILLFFYVILGRPGRSTEWAQMQFVRACVVETHFSISLIFCKQLPKVSTLDHFVNHFHRKSSFCANERLRKKGMEKVPAQVDPGGL